MTTHPLDSWEYFRLLGLRTARSARRVDQAICDRAERKVTVFVSDDRSVELGGRPFELTRIPC